MRQLAAILLLIAVTAPAQHKSTTKAMLLCAFPGGGQFYTHRHVTGIIIAGGELTLGYFAYRMHAEHRPTERNSLLWYLAFLAGYSLADAYVGARMFNFKAETDVDQGQARVSVGLQHLW